MSQDQNIWKFVKPTFHLFSPPFRGLTSQQTRVTNETEIVDALAKYYEKHFEAPVFDIHNPTHTKADEIYKLVGNMPNIPLEPIKMDEVIKQFNKLKSKKSLDSTETSAFLLKKIPYEYLQTLSVLFNKCAQNGTFFKKSKHAKIICLSKDGIYSEANRMRPISLLPNIGKWFERIVHERIMKWCERKGIYIDEQSGFTPGRRLQTKILSLCEDLRLTTVACNRSALVIFVDFLSAFDKLWYPALIKHLYELDMPRDLLRWIYGWLQDRSFSIHYSDIMSRVIRMYVGAPQGSVLAATLFRLHLHFLPQCFFQAISHLFADDLAIVLTGSLEKRFSHNIEDLEKRAQTVLKALEKFSDDNILPALKFELKWVGMNIF
ncbi:unnamed protein product [Didymodactylos carnosus]|uniref:Reverse transcriptase domain-containing protein n=1 Tax=Didymodactylos carnosus TaxID=1234261 RepID=A0A8S2TUM5_9BILA|nr:unnamed protein product [Didymodactylos carnosus]